MTINDQGVMTVFGKQVAATLGNDWMDIKISFNTEKKTVTIYVNQEAALTDYNFGAALSAGYNLDSLKVRFGGWLWTKGEKLGYFVDDISIDQMPVSYTHLDVYKRQA